MIPKIFSVNKFIYIGAIIIIEVFVSVCNGYGFTNFNIRRIDHCDPNGNYPINMSLTIKTIDGAQYLSGAFIFHIEVGRNVRSNFSIEALRHNTSRYVFSITENSLCVAMHKYMGEFIYDIERNARIMPGVCPIQKGVYRVHNYRLNFNTISLQTFPFGQLRFTEVAYDRKNNVCLCLIIELDNPEI